VTAGAVLAALLALVAVGHEYRVLRDLRELMELKAATLARSEGMLHGLNQQLQAGARQLAALESGQTAARPGPRPSRADATPAASRGPTPEKAKADAQLFLASDPALRPMVEKAARMQYQTLFGPFFRQQNLSAQQIDQLMGAATDTWLQTLAIGPGGAIYPTQQQPSPDALTAILGPDVYQQLLTYQRSLQAVNFTQQVATEAGYSSAPLYPAQQDKIAEMIAGASDAYQNGKAVNLATVDWEAVLKQVGSAGLSPAQSDALERMVANQQYRTALQQAMQPRTAP